MTVEELSESLDASCNEIKLDNFQFKIDQVSEYFLTNELSNKLILRKLNDNIKRIYKDEQANRRIIIAQLKILLSESCPYWVIKTDVKSFYESINREQMISKFHDDSLLSYQSMYLLKRIFESPTLVGTTGLPRGMNISATLSEIYMRRFDKWIRRLGGVYYYARFVDDIIIFSNSLSTCMDLIRNLDSKLSELAGGLRINILKTELFEGKTLRLLDIESGRPAKKIKHLDYLGYSFRKEIEPTKTLLLRKFQNIENLKYTVENTYSAFLHEMISYVEFNSIQNPKEIQLKVTIADKKIRKIKTRIIKALLDYSKENKFDLLERRVRFLTGNYSIRKDGEGNDLRAGIYYNYLQVTEMEVFSELNSFFRKALFSKSKGLGIKVSLTHVQKKRLSKYCFIAGFKNKVYNKFTFLEMREIIDCW